MKDCGVKDCAEEKEKEAGYSTEPKTRTPHKDVRKNVDLFENPIFYLLQDYYVHEIYI